MSSSVGAGGPSRGSLPPVPNSLVPAEQPSVTRPKSKASTISILEHASIQTGFTPTSTPGGTTGLNDDPNLGYDGRIGMGDLDSIINDGESHGVPDVVIQQAKEWKAHFADEALKEGPEKGLIIVA